MNSSDLESLVSTARAAVGRARWRLRAGRPQHVIGKGDRDMVSDIDLAVERELRDALYTATPDIGFHGEEDGARGPTGLRWVLDPVDGTANFIRGLPLCGISLALIDHTHPVLGVIDLPLIDREYWAADGLGAWRNGAPINPATTALLAEAMIAIGDYGTGDDAPERNQITHTLHRVLASTAQRVRMLGSAAVDLAFVADGTLDASITLGNRSWDMAAGVVIAREAGAAVLDTDGTPHTTDSIATIAAAPHLRDRLMAVIADATTGTRYRKEPPC